MDSTTSGQQIPAPSGARIALSQLADIRLEAGPVQVSRERAQRLVIVQANVSGRDLGSFVKDVQAAVREGQPMSSALRRHKIFPEMVTQMIEVGEESGQISQMLDKVADFYDREVDSAAESLTASIEPIMVLVMGAVVGGMVICLYLPMFTIYQNIQSN